jgi:hypothetical protein
MHDYRNKAKQYYLYQIIYFPVKEKMTISLMAQNRKFCLPASPYYNKVILPLLKHKVAKSGLIEVI